MFFLGSTFRLESGTLLGLSGDYEEARAGPETGVGAGEGSAAILFLRTSSFNPRTDFFLCSSFDLGAILDRRDLQTAWEI